VRWKRGDGQGANPLVKSRCACTAFIHSHTHTPTHARTSLSRMYTRHLHIRVRRAARVLEALERTHLVFHTCMQTQPPHTPAHSLAHCQAKFKVTHSQVAVCHLHIRVRRAARVLERICLVFHACVQAQPPRTPTAHLHLRTVRQWHTLMGGGMQPSYSNAPMIATFPKQTSPAIALG
jgi:hypothetical protein